MKLLQLNIWEGRLLQQTLAFIEQQKPDLLCLQEVFSCQEEVKVLARVFNSLELIKDLTGFEYSFFSPTFSTHFAGTKINFGNAIVSRHPLKDKQSVFTNGFYNEKMTTNNFVSNSRVLQTCRVVLSDSSFSLANHHGHWEATPIGSDTTIEKMQVVSDSLKKLAVPLILAGDLNVTSKSPAMRVFDESLRDLVDEYSASSTLSQLGKVDNVACDHILVSPGVKVDDFFVAEDLVSDHKALVMEFSV